MSEGMIALAGAVVGAFIAGLIPWAQSFVARRSERLQAARYLAIRVVCALDRYVEDAVGIVFDDGLSCGQRDKDGCLSPQKTLPKPIAYPDDVDWRSIDHGLMYDLLSLPNQGEAANNAIAAAGDLAGPPDYEEYFEQRHSEYASLGLKAGDLARKLRAAYSIPDAPNSQWDPTERLEDAQQRLDALKAKRMSADPFGMVAA